MFKAGEMVRIGKSKALWKVQKSSQFDRGVLVWLERDKIQRSEWASRLSLAEVADA